MWSEHLNKVKIEIETVGQNKKNDFAVISVNITGNKEEDWLPRK